MSIQVWTQLRRWAAILILAAWAAGTDLADLQGPPDDPAPYGADEGCWSPWPVPAVRRSGARGNGLGDRPGAQAPYFAHHRAALGLLGIV